MEEKNPFDIANAIEVESVEVEGSQAEVHRSEKPKKAEHQYGRQIEALLKAEWVMWRLFYPLLILGLIGTLFSTILFVQTPNPLSIVLFIFALFVLSCGLAALILYFIFKAIRKGLMKLDPNFSED